MNGNSVRRDAIKAITNYRLSDPDATLNVANGLTLPKLTTVNNARLWVDLKEANVGTATPALTVKDVQTAPQLQLFVSAFPKTLASGDVIYLIKTEGGNAFGAGNYKAPTDMRSKVENFVSLYLEATKGISVPVLTVVSNPKAKTGEEYVGVVKIEDVVFTDIDW